MQVELIGCTSAGKSTLTAALTAAACEEEIDFSLGDDVVLKHLGARSVRNKPVRAALLHAVASAGCFLFSWRHIGFMRLSHRVLKYSGIPLSQRLNQLRKVLKQLGRYEIVSRRHVEKEIVLVDEGTVHAAHNIFVHETGDPRGDDIQAFAEIVPLPDLLIYLSVAEETLIERTLRRGHPRITAAEREIHAKFVRRTVSTFDQLSQHERIASRLLIVRDGQIVSGSEIAKRRSMETVMQVLDRAIQSLREKSSEHRPKTTPRLEVIS